MNAEIELHDSELGSVTEVDGSVVVSLSPAYVHRSLGVPGRDSGSGWTQDAVLTFGESRAAVVKSEMPVWIASGRLRVGEAVFENMIPTSGVWEGEAEFSVVLVTGEKVMIRGRGVSIALRGEATWVEEF